MGLLNLPSGNIVRSVVRVPDSGWNTSLPLSLLDISRYSSVAAAVYVGQGLISQQSPESTSSERNTVSKNSDEHLENSKLKAISAPSAVKVNGSRKKLVFQAKTSTKTISPRNTYAYPVGVPSKIPSKTSSVSINLSSNTPNIVKKVPAVRSAFTTAGTSSTLERKRQRPEDLEEGVAVVEKSPSSKIHKTAEFAQSRTNNHDLSHKLEESTVVLIPASSSSFIQQHSVQLQQNKRQSTNGSSGTSNVQCQGEGKESYGVLVGRAKAKTVSKEVQTEQNDNHELCKSCQENEELKLKNINLQQGLTAFQNIFKDKEKLKKLIRVIYAHSLSN